MGALGWGQAPPSPMVPASPDRPADLGPRRTERSNSPLPFLAEKEKGE